jgi:hypothetical protein
MFRNSILLIGFVLAFALSNTAEADPDLLLWWKFDEGSGTTAIDSSGNNRHGTLVGPPTWVSSLPGFGSALDFGGDGDHVIDADAASYMEGLSALSVALWIKSDVIGTDSGFIIFENPGGQDKKNIRYDSDGGGGDINLFKYGVTTGANVREEDESPSNLQSTDWQHVCVTWKNGTTAATFPNGLNFYLNGELLTPEEDDGDFVANGVTSAYDRVMVGKGCKDEGAAEGWDGIVDDVQIYSRKLTQEEIDAIILGRGAGEAYNPDPADGAIDVPVDANLSWTRDEGAVQDEVYFGTDPCALTLVTTIMNLPPFPPLYNPPVDLIASTTYYWQIVEVNGPDRFGGAIWEFTTVRGEAQPDFPYDGGVIVGDEVTHLGEDYIWTKLMFIPGATTVSHVGYFHEDLSKVESRDPAAYLGAPPYATIPGWEYTLFAGNPQVPPANYTLVRGTKYYWAVDSNDALDNWFSSDTWEFAVQGYYAFAPSPPNEATLVSRDVFLSWLPGYGSEDHDIYMGTSWEDVNNAEYDALNPPPEFVISRKDPNYPMTELEGDTKHYWRVDEVIGRMPPPIGGGTYYKGEVWCFTTMPEFVLSDPNLVGWWKFDLGVEGIAYDWSGHGNDGTINGNLEFVPGFYGNAMDFPGDNQGWVELPGSITTTAKGSIAMWVNTNLTNDEGMFWYGTQSDGDGYGGQNEIHINIDDPGQLDFFLRQGPAGGGDITLNGPQIAGAGWVHVAATWDLTDGCRLYLNGAEVGNGAHTGLSVSLSVMRLGRPVGTGNGNRFYDGLMDDVQLYDYALSASQIRNLGAPPEAWLPKPYDGQASVPLITTLQWLPGKYAAQHDVYFGTDKNAVTNATVTTPGIYMGRIGPNTLGPMGLSAGTLYYWRIDEVNVAGPDPYMWKGDTWTFRAVGAAGGLLGLYYHWDGVFPPAYPGGPPDPGPVNPFQIFVMSRIDPTVNFNWGNGSPDPNINVDNFACRWVGHVECPVDANYTFYTTTDDGARLLINGVQILPTDAWQQQGMTEWSGSVVLTAGLHDIEMHHEEGDGGAGAQLRWSAIPTNPSDEAITKQIIPAVWLWPPLFASGPRPPDGSTIDDRMPALEWIAGVNADYHELYFSINFDDVNNRNPAVKQTMTDPCRPYPAVPPLRLATTYYWCVDEVKISPADRWDARTVWSFTISECLSLDNMEDYNDRGELRQVWRDGNAEVVWGGTYPYLRLTQGGSNGSNLNVSSAVGTPVNGAIGPIPPMPLNYESMVLRYDNDGFTYTGLPGEEKWVYDAPYYSEIEANTIDTNGLGVGQTWDSEGVKSISLSFQGHPISDGYYDASTWPVYTINGRGRDIWGRHDEFYYLSQYPFIGNGSIQAQVLRMDHTDNWAKAGIMIREKWAPYSRYAAVFITPNQGVAFQYRVNEDGPTVTVTKPGVSAPQFVRLVRNIDGTFEAKHSNNPFVWQDVNAPGTAPVFPTIAMGTIDDPNVYIGSAVTSHNANQVCSVDFNELLISPLPPNWIFGNIGTNDPEQLYVAVSDGTNTSVVEHDDVNAATLTTWQEWNIELSDFTTVNLDGIKKVYIGFGDRAAPVQGGSGAIYVDDIRACPPRCVPAFAQMIGDIAQPYDCTVDEKDIRVFAADYLLADDFISSVTPSFPIVQYQFEGNYQDSMGSYHGTAMGGASIISDFDRGQVLSLDGDGDYVDCGNPTDPCELDFGTGNWTVCAWVKTTMSGSGGDPEKGVIYGKGGDQGGGHRYGLYVNENQSTEGRITLITDDNSNKVMVDGSVINDGEWHHVLGLRDADDLRLYVDGMPDGTATLPVGYDLSGTHQHNAYIGTITAHGDDPNGTVVYKYLRGSVDEVHVYDYALSEGEVAYLSTDGGAGIHFPIVSDADVYKGEAPGNQWINFKDYALIVDQYLEKLLWPTP